MSGGNTKERGQFSTRLGFIVACIGSAVGMGNIWMFPYRLGQYGGGAFFIPYLFFVVLFGLVGLSAEFAIGRLAGPVGIGRGNGDIRHGNDQMKPLPMARGPRFQQLAASVPDAGLTLQKESAVAAQPGSDCGQSMACASRTAGHSQGAREEEEVRDTGSHVALKIAACVGERTMCDAPASRRGAKKFWRVSEGHVACGSRRL